jgi:glycosyltransferase involved in cell wall biosynthesis
MNNIPKISVIVPVYNNEHTVSDSLDSLFKQTLRNMEVIAVDDASTDSSGEILDRLAVKEPRLKVLHLHTNVGVHEARVAGLKLAESPYMGFLDADDFARANMFQVMLRDCVQHDADIAICGARICSEKRTFRGIKIRFRRNATVCDDIFGRFCRLDFGTGALWNKIYRRELIMRYAPVNFRWRQDATEDTLVNIGCFWAAKRVRLVHDMLYDYISNPDSATNSASKALSFTRILRAYAIALELYGGFGKEALAGITELYARQLQYGAYHVEDPEEMCAHEERLSEAVTVISANYPIGLAMLANRGWLNNRDSNSVINRVKRILRNAMLV